MNNTTVHFLDSTIVVAPALWQWDYGQTLTIEGLDLPEPFEVHFCNYGNTVTTTQIGSNGVVAIPDAYLTSGMPVIAYIFLHTGESDGETEYKIAIPVRPRQQPSDAPPTPEQQSAITEAIAALNAAVSHYPKIVYGYWVVWDAAAGEWVNTGVKAEGEDGFSPEVTITEISGGHRVTITDEEHPDGQSFDVMDGVTPTVDSELSDSSTNPVQNKVITGEIGDLKSAFDDVFTFTENKSLNRLNPTTITSGSYLSNADAVISQSGYGYSDYIAVEAGDVVRCTYWSNVASSRGLFYNENKEKISTVTGVPDLTTDASADIPYWQCTAPAGSKYLRVNVRPAYITESWMVTLNNSFPSTMSAYTGDSIEKELDSDVIVTMPYYPKLYGKKIMFCGDSITYGTRADTDSLGNKKNYGWYIQKATGCVAQFNAVQGSTMMNVTGKSPFCVNRYTQLGDDLDYIILAFSTNDSANSNDLIGDYSSTADTTFWGAWKKVLAYLIDTYPTAKIGIIAFWRGNQNYLYTDALREIAQKFRIPMLDFMFDEHVPLVGGSDFRSYNPNAPFTVDYNTLVARQDAFLYDTVHPNDAGYRYLAPIIQAYIERL